MGTKKSIYLWLSALVLTMAGLSSCSKDDGFVEPANSSPEFSEGTGQNPRYAGGYKTTSTNGVEISKDSQGGIRLISFFENRDAAPASAKELFSKYMKLDLDENFRLYMEETEDWMENPLTLECYQQQYKGVIVYSAGYNVRFRDGKVTDCNGEFIKIDNLDVTPAFSEQKAKEIYARYLKVSVNEIGTGGIMAWFNDALMIEEFPVSKGSSQWAPRLVYALSCHKMSNDGCCFIDAHSGRILETWSPILSFQSLRNRGTRYQNNRFGDVHSLLFHRTLRTLDDSKTPLIRRSLWRRKYRWFPASQF